jgi:lysophospholipase L1-like esterase
MSLNRILWILLILAGVFVLFWIWRAYIIPSPTKTTGVEARSEESITQIRYAALGDSYSNGQGESPDAAWPVLLTKHLNEEGLDVELVANPSISGWTTQDLIKGELEEFKLSKPNFATLLIGANDIFQGIDEKVFRKNLVTIFDAMQEVLPDKKKIIVVTIPDYSATPHIKSFPNVGDLRPELKRFNGILKEEAKKRDLMVVDIFELTQAMGKDASLVAPDGLHPSAKELKLWEEKIFPVAHAMLK